MNLNKFPLWQKLAQIDPKIYAIFFSLLWSMLCYLQIDLVNNDGILYLRAAQAFNLGGYRGAHAIYPWPFYSILIALVTKLFHLSYLLSAITINAIFYMIISVTFIEISKILFTDKKLAYLALLVILIYPSFNHYRFFIIRDIGFYSLNLLMIYMLLLYVANSKIKHLALGIAMAFCALLFRIEGCFYLISLPAILLISVPTKQQRQQILWVICFGVLVIGILFLMSDYHIWLDTYTGRFTEIKNMFLQQNFSSKLATMKYQILNHHSEESASLFLFGGLTIYYLFKLVYSIHIIFFILAGIGIYQMRQRWNFPQFRLIFCFILLGVVITYVFTLINFFIVGRYFIPLSMFCLLFVVPGLQTFNRWNKYPHLTALIAIIIAVSGLIIFKNSHEDLQSVIMWSKANIPLHAKVFTNQPQIMYSLNYSPNAPEWEFVDPYYNNIELVKAAKLLNYDYLLIKYQHDEHAPILQLLSSLPVKKMTEFVNKHGDGVIVYRVIHH